MALAGAAVILGAAPVAAVTDATAVVEQCGEQPVCLVDGAKLESKQHVESVLPQGVRVVVIPQPDQSQNVLSSGELATQVKQQTGVDTVIVIEDRAVDRFGVASSGDEVAITTELNAQHQSDGGEAVVAIASTLASPADTAAPVGGAVVGGGLALVVAAAAGALVFTRRRRQSRLRHADISTQRLEKELDAALKGPDGAALHEAIERLHVRAAAYPAIGGRLSSLAEHLSELFVRARKRGTDQQIRLLQSQYKDTLSKLHKALDEDYYGDITANPQYWSNPGGRSAEVQRAIESVDRQAVENIKQMNESRDLDFKVALDSLIKTVAEAKLSDVYTDREK